MQENAHRRETVFFIDPPYVVAGKRLYTHSDIDHEMLFQVTDGLAGDFLITYDNTAEIRSLAEKHDFQLREIPMKTTHHERKIELLIGRDLGWLDRWLTRVSARL